LLFDEVKITHLCDICKYFSNYFHTIVLFIFILNNKAQQLTRNIAQKPCKVSAS